MSSTETGTESSTAGDWWRTAVVYQVLLRSFADGDGDGVGDLAGLRARLPHLAALGVDAVWVNPWYPSPMVDAGYDVADYRDVDPRLRDAAGGAGLRGRGARAGDARAARRRPQPHLRRPPLVPRGAGR
ncbi:MAG: alpha-amylase family glycosyl hydrolase [Quadrisphaera sp.]